MGRNGTNVFSYIHHCVAIISDVYIVCIAIENDQLLMTICISLYSRIYLSVRHADTVLSLHIDHLIFHINYNKGSAHLYIKKSGQSSTVHLLLLFYLQAVYHKPFANVQYIVLYSSSVCSQSNVCLKTFIIWILINEP